MPLALGLQLDPVVSLGASASPLPKLAGEEDSRAQIFDGLNQSKTYVGTSHRPRD